MVKFGHFYENPPFKNSNQSVCFHLNLKCLAYSMPPQTFRFETFLAIIATGGEVILKCIPAL